MIKHNSALSILHGVLILALLSLTACSSNPDDPEQQIREMLTKGEKAVEERSITSVLDHVTDNYKDKYGRNKKEIKRIVAAYILRNQSIHLLTRIHEIALNEDQTRAEVILYVGMAGVPVDNAEQLVYTRADLYRFDLSLALESGEWLVTAGTWDQARLENF